MSKVVDGHHGFFVSVIDFVNAVAKDIEDIVGVDGDVVGGEGDARHAADDHAWSGEFFDLVVLDEDGGRVAAAGVEEVSGGFVVDAVPEGEVHLVLFFHVEGFVHAGEDGGGVEEVDACEALGAEDVDGGDGEEGGADAMAADVEEVEGEVVVVDPVVAKGVAPEVG